jgi:chromosome segregation ATPase
VECLKRKNQHLLENNERLNEVNRDLPKTSGLMYDFCVGKHEAQITVMWSHMKANASNLDTALKKAEIEKNHIRQKLDSVSRDLNAEQQNHNTLLKTSQSQWEPQPAVKYLAREFNTY